MENQWYSARPPTATSRLTHPVRRTYTGAAAGGEPVAITSGEDSYSNPKFRPDGKALYAQHSRREDEALYSLSRLALMSWPPSGSPPRLITSRWDRSVGGIAFTPDSQRIYLIAEDQGNDRLFTLPADGGSVQPLSDLRDGTYSALAIPEHAGAPVLVALWGSMVHPEDLVLVNPRPAHTASSPVSTTSESRRSTGSQRGTSGSPPRAERAFTA